MIHTHHHHNFVVKIHPVMSAPLRVMEAYEGQARDIPANTRIQKITIRDNGLTLYLFLFNQDVIIIYVYIHSHMPLLTHLLDFVHCCRHKLHHIIALAELTVDVVKAKLAPAIKCSKNVIKELDFNSACMPLRIAPHSESLYRHWSDS